MDVEWRRGSVVWFVKDELFNNFTMTIINHRLVRYFSNLYFIS